MTSREDTVAKLLDCVVTLLHEIGSDRDAQAAHVATLFCAMTDDGQAQFFVHVARLMAEWGMGKTDQQCYYIGKHLVECECSSEQGRELIAALAEHVDYHKTRAAVPAGGGG